MSPPSALHAQSHSAVELSALVIPLLKGVVYRNQDDAHWNALLNAQAHVRDYVAVLGLDLHIDEAEGYAFLRSRADDDAADDTQHPRLIARRPLSFAVSLLLALLRKKLAEFDATGGDTRLVLARNELIELVRVFLPAASNEAKLTDQVDANINKVAELGFLRKLKTPAGQETQFEVQRILAAFVDGQWLADFEQRLADYRTHLTAGQRETIAND